MKLPKPYTNPLDIAYDQIRINNQIRRYGTDIGLVIFNKGIPFFCPLDEEDYSRCKTITWRIKSEGSYKRICSHEVGYMHRFIMNAPANMQVDHVNSDALDNRKKNLRLASHSQNNWNMKMCGNSLGIKGIKRNGNGFTGHVKLDGVIFCTETVRSLPEAEELTRELRDTLHGDFANHG